MHTEEIVAQNLHALLPGTATITELEAAYHDAPASIAYLVLEWESDRKIVRGMMAEDRHRDERLADCEAFYDEGDDNERN